jgi:hypothetical protein
LPESPPRTSEHEKKQLVHGRGCQRIAAIDPKTQRRSSETGDGDHRMSQTEATPTDLCAGAGCGPWCRRTGASGDLRRHQHRRRGGGSLCQAISDANASPGSDQIIFDSSVTGTIFLRSGPLTNDGFASYYYENVADRLVITGPGADRLAIDGNAGSSVIESFLYGADSSLAISGVTLKNADRGLLISGRFGAATAITIADSGITATADAGIEIFDWLYTGWGTVRLENLVISGNSGTGVVIVGGDTEMVGSVIADRYRNHRDRKQHHYR